MPTTSLLPEDNASPPWANTAERAVLAAERIFARLDALDRDIREDMTRDVRLLLDLARKADSALDRIASAEEARNVIAREEAQAKRDSDAQALANKKAWLEKIWSSPAMQLFILALVLGVMQLLGLQWLAQQVAPGLIGVGN